jgi:hypothetical protein
MKYVLTAAMLMGVSILGMLLLPESGQIIIKTVDEEVIELRAFRPRKVLPLLAVLGMFSIVFVFAVTESSLYDAFFSGFLLVGFSIYALPYIIINRNKKIKPTIDTIFINRRMISRSYLQSIYIRRYSKFLGPKVYSIGLRTCDSKNIPLVILKDLNFAKVMQDQLSIVFGCNKVDELGETGN